MVAATPSGAMPTSSPTSTPTLSGDQAKHPTSSRDGLAAIALTDSLPTLPVVHCTTRTGMPSPDRSLRTERRHTLYHGGARPRMQEISCISRFDL